MLHVHLSDAEAAPAESRAFPVLWDGPHSAGERYTTAEVGAGARMHMRVTARACVL